MRFQGHTILPVLCNIRVPALQQAIIPQHCDFAQLSGKPKLAQSLLVVFIRRKDIRFVVLHVHEQNDLILSSGPQRRLDDQRTDVLQILSLPLVSSPSAHDNGCPSRVLELVPLTSLGDARDVSVSEANHLESIVEGGSRGGEAMAVSLEAFVLELAPVDLVPVDL